jgi:hypothetical protein
MLQRLNEVFDSLFSPDLYCKLTPLSYQGQKHGLRFSLYYESRDSFSCFLRQLQVESPREIGANLEGKSAVFFGNAPILGHYPAKAPWQKIKLFSKEVGHFKRPTPTSILYPHSAEDKLLKIMCFANTLQNFSHFCTFFLFVRTFLFVL